MVLFFALHEETEQKSCLECQLNEKHHGPLQEQLRLKSRAERFKDQLSNAPLAKAAIKSKPSTAAAAEFEAKKKVCLL